MRIVIDTNILVSGLRSKRGYSFELLSLLGSEKFQPVVTVPLVVEYEKSLMDPQLKVPFPKQDIENFINYYCSESILQEVHFLWRPYLRDPNDDMVLEAAVSGRCEYIVTFNIKDFTGVERFGLRALPPLDFLKVIGEEL